MRARMLFLLVLVATMLVAAAPAMAQAGSPDPVAGAPGVWTERVCQGEDALVYQGVDEVGAGVTLSTADAWGCSDEPQFGLLVIEPWGPGSQNPDTACWAETWDVVGDFADRTELVNGSAWVLSERVDDHVMVVDCEDVDSPDDLGLNPYEGQFAPEALERVFEIATIKLPVPADRSAYCLASASERLGDYLCGRWWINYQAAWKLWAGP